MTHWNPQHYRIEAQRAERPTAVISNALAAAECIENPSIPPIFTLRHLSYLTDVEYRFLRRIVMRVEQDTYRIFRIRKRQLDDGLRRYRLITVPQFSLKKVQRWIAQRIIAQVRPHYSSVAFSKGDTVKDAVQLHCGARWIIKMDIVNFFESISEVSIYRVFRSLGYQPLISMEMARICTRFDTNISNRLKTVWPITHERKKIKSYSEFASSDLGHLPQGAPTSPMLANLAVRNFDCDVEAIAKRFQLVYTRYADDLILSTSQQVDRLFCREVICRIYNIIKKHGFVPNKTKTSIQTPGSRKLVLGLLVNGKTPRLTREFRSNMRRHLYYLSAEKIGPIAHASHLGFSSVLGFKNHIYGLAAFASQIEPEYGSKCIKALNSIKWEI